MKQLSLISAGILASVAVSWAGLVLVSQVQLAGLAPAPAEDGGPLKPSAVPGQAVIGKDVYIAQGCVACHTQQVRPNGIGGDISRGFARRPSVARDYILQDRVLLGESRLGPDLTDVGSRATDEDRLHLQLFDPRAVTPGSAKPAYRHLYQLVPAAQARHALRLPAGHPDAAPAGMAWVPTERATALVAYLRSLRIDHASPEAPLPE